jgi:hypothetical protein
MPTRCEVLRLMLPPLGGKVRAAWEERERVPSKSKAVKQKCFIAENSLVNNGRKVVPVAFFVQKIG